MTNPNRLTPDDLRVGACYLHSNGAFVRTIDSIEGDTVRWHDQYGPGICSRKAFLRVCYVEAPDNHLPAAAEQGSASHIVMPSPPSEFSIRDEANTLTA